MKNREIKFRAWNKEKQFISDWEDIQISLLTNSTNVFNINHFELMQFTGLKDKNGKEIYEGDIVLYTCNEGTFKTTVKWGVKRHGFVLNVYLSTKCWNKDKIFSLPASKHIEIIGNIYENKD